MEFSAVGETTEVISGKTGCIEATPRITHLEKIVIVKLLILSILDHSGSFVLYYYHLFRV